jgi:hypothetical protein
MADHRPIAVIDLGAVAMTTRASTGIRPRSVTTNRRTLA